MEYFNIILFENQTFTFAFEDVVCTSALMFCFESCFEAILCNVAEMTEPWQNWVIFFNQNQVAIPGMFIYKIISSMKRIWYSRSAGLVLRLGITWWLVPRHDKPASFQKEAMRTQVAL